MGTGIRTSNEDANDNIQGINTLGLLDGVNSVITAKGNRGLFVTAQHKNPTGSPALKPSFTITNIDGTTCEITLPLPVAQGAVKTVYLPLQVKSVSAFIGGSWQDSPAPPNDFNYYVSILK
jgi:hypothetical protein